MEATNQSVIAGCASSGLGAVKVLIDEFLDLVSLAVISLAKVLVVVAPELFQESLDHHGREYTVFLIDFTIF